MALQYPKNTDRLNLGGLDAYLPAYCGDFDAVIAAVNDIIDGTTSLTEVEVGNGTAATPSMTFTSDTDTGIYRKNTNQLAFTTGGTSRAFFSTTALNMSVDISATANTISALVFAAADGSVGAPSISFTSDPDSGMYIIGANNIGVAVGGAKVLDIASTGLGVTGIITNTSTTDSTSKDTGAIITEGGIGVEKAIFAGTTINAGTRIFTGDGTAALPSYSFTNDPNTGIFSSAANTIGFTTDGVEKWVINSSGAINPILDNTYDIGNGTVNPRDISISRGVKAYGAALVGSSPVGTSVATTFGDGKDFTTVLTLTNFIVGALDGAAAAKGIGNIVYSFPAGMHLELVYSLSSIVLTAAGTAVATDTGLGSVIASGAVNVLSGTGTFEDRLTGQTINTAAGGGAAVSALTAATAGIGTGISLNVAASVKDVFLNSAGTWNVDNTGNLTATGTIVLKWTKMS